VTIARRLANLEISLTPTGLVLRWLEGAHAFGSLEAYLSWLIDQPSGAAPLNRLARQAADGARAAMRGKVSEQVDKAVRQAVRETVFRFELVMRINVTTLEILEKEVYVHAALAGLLGMLASEVRPERLVDPEHRQRLASCRDLSNLRVTELQAAQEARSIAEARYLDGHRALFSDSMRTWDEQLESADGLADIACTLADLDEMGVADPMDPDASAGQISLLVADLVEPAKAAALDKLGEGEQAIRVVTGWYRAKSAPPSRATTDAA
jgi:hypothetical protein